MTDVLLQTEYIAIERHDERTLIYLRRSQPYPSAEAIVRDFRSVFASLEPLDTPAMGLLVDLRGVAGRNDAEFESAHSTQRAKLMHSFRRVAVLVSSHVGKLQVTRLANSDGGNFRAFYDREEALAWLAS